MIGTVLNNRYRIDATLGEGGMGVVYKAHDTLLDRPVAVKVFSRQLATDGAERLLREARSVAQLDHPHIVTVYDAGEIDGQPFIVMLARRRASYAAAGSCLGSGLGMWINTRRSSTAMTNSVI